MELQDNVREFIVRHVLDGSNRPGVLSDTDSLVNSGLVNSLSIVEIITFIEERFGVDVGDGEIDINDFDSVNNICDLIQRKGRRR